MLHGVLRQKYFPYSNFFEAGLSSTPSFTWRSLLAMQNLLVACLHSKVSDGQAIPNSDLIKVEFHPLDASCILGVALHTEERDTLVWHYDKHGRLSGGSAYQVAKMLGGEVGASGTLQTWRFIWKSKAQPKVLLFASKAARDALPTLTAWGPWKM
ncbi:UNVERIFIED_CONTAM: hypothetical protein Sradi_5247000 [Sesamum radiatum]|uniref:Uncharacterized protein n=1 Tax=Sesamum radiatum TaxID=300843 RepID=A0AAW2LNC3_SESRA